MTLIKNCQVAAGYMYTLCEAAGIKCSIRTRARNDTIAAQDHVNNVVDIDGTPYIVDANLLKENLYSILLLIIHITAATQNISQEAFLTANLCIMCWMMAHLQSVSA